MNKLRRQLPTREYRRYINVKKKETVLRRSRRGGLRIFNNLNISKLYHYYHYRGINFAILESHGIILKEIRGLSYKKRIELYFHTQHARWLIKPRIKVNHFSRKSKKNTSFSRKSGNKKLSPKLRVALWKTWEGKKDAEEYFSIKTKIPAPEGNGTFFENR